ncbi:hypothetical protein OUZ56_003281 [Daphnia magna]|uniref:Uncharacterized protein n=1 Tax=Daphnia magna TaxID=35525 RepID=A0ABR0A899_9CRUS|nr:hypothetical protein OUZ56_003281 [Daphnia magna]
MGWDGPSFVMINGQRTAPLGALELEIEHREMKASGKVGDRFGQMEVVEPSIVAVDEVGTPDSLGDDVREDAA